MLGTMVSNDDCPSQIASGAEADKEREHNIPIRTRDKVEPKIKV